MSSKTVTQIKEVCTLRRRRQMLTPGEILRREPSLSRDHLKYLGASGKVYTVQDPHNSRNHLYDYLEVKKRLAPPKYLRSQTEILDFLKSRGMEIVRQTLRYWADHCEILGRPFRTHHEPHSLRLWDIRDAEEVLKKVRAMPEGGRPDQFQHKGRTWIWTDDAAVIATKSLDEAGVKFTVCPATIDLYLNKGKGGCPALDGRVFESCDGWVRNPRADRVYRRTYVLLTDVQDFVTAITAIYLTTTRPLAEKDQLTKGEVAKEFPRFGRSPKAFLCRYSTQRHHATGHQLERTAEKRIDRAGSGAGRVREVPVWGRASLQELYTAIELDPKRERDSTPKTPRLIDGRVGLNDAAVWLEVPHNLLRYWSWASCPYRKAGPGPLDAVVQVRGVGSPHGKTSELAFLPDEVNAAVEEYKRCREAAASGRSGIFQEGQEGPIYRSAYAARRAYPDGRLTTQALGHCRRNCTTALGRKKIRHRFERIPDGPLGIPDWVFVYLDEDLKSLADWNKARARLYSHKWDGKPDYTDGEGGWVIWSRIPCYGLESAAVHSRVTDHIRRDELDGEAPRGKRVPVPGGRDPTWVYHMDDLARMGAAEAGKPPPQPQWKRTTGTKPTANDNTPIPVIFHGAVPGASLPVVGEDGRGPVKVRLEPEQEQPRSDGQNNGTTGAPAGLVLRSDDEYPLIDGKPAGRRLTLAEYEAVAFVLSLHAKGIIRPRSEELEDLDHPTRRRAINDLSRDPEFGRFVSTPQGRKGKGFAILNTRKS